MDKKAEKNTIKFSIGPRKQETEQQPLVQDWKKGMAETAAAAEKSEKQEEQEEKEEFQWILPEANSSVKGEEHAKVLYVPSEHKQKKGWKFAGNSNGKKAANIMLVIASAMVIGILFGYGMIKVVTQKEPAGPVTNVLQDETAPTKQDQPDGQAVPPAENPSNAAAVTIPEFTTGIIQGGVFNTEESANKIQQTFKEQQIPAVRIQHEGQYLLVVGLAENLETAKLTGSAYKEQGADVFAKTLTIPAKQAAMNEEDAATIPKLLDSFAFLSEASAKITNSQTADQAQLTAEEEKVKALVPKHAEVKMLQTYLLQGYEKAREGNPQGGKDAQAQLLSFLQAYTNLK
ncbi:MAG TPA: hypothetical protein VEY51_05825 [Chondromyces sp.]|nr:hypothetical protein [Chondromyces sp.]